MQYLGTVHLILSRLAGICAQSMISLSSILFGLKADRLQRSLLKMRGVQVSGPVFMGRGIYISNPERLLLAERVAIGENAVIACHATISIGQDFLAAPGLYLNSGGHDTSTLKAFAKPIAIGKRVWCGTRVTICAGVEIGDDVVVAAGAVVVKSVPANSIVAGVPARLIGTVERDPAQFESWYNH